jgi:hypothetical protein
VLRAAAAVKLATRAFIEQRGGDGKWSAYEDIDGGKGYRLVEGCAEVDPPSCRALEAGDVLVPEPWSGYSCGAQCNSSCDKNVFRAGVHRLVVTACDDPKRRFEGEPFEIPTSESMLARRCVTYDVVRATIARLDARRPTIDPGEASADRRAGFAVVAGSEKAMEVDSRSELVKWLRNKDGFQDGRADAKKNCAQQPVIGFSLTSSSAPGKERTAEVAVEFGCNRVTVVHEQAGRRVTDSSFFDPSRTVIVGIADRGLPAETDLRRLQ